MAAGELRSLSSIYPRSVGGVWKMLSQIHGGWESSDATKRHDWSGLIAQSHRETSKSWSPVRQSYWTKKTAHFKAVCRWNKFTIALSKTLVFLISTFILFQWLFPNFTLLVESESLRLIINNFIELRNWSQGKFKYRPYNPLVIAAFIFQHNNLMKPGWEERFTSHILIKRKKKIRKEKKS